MKKLFTLLLVCSSSACMYARIPSFMEQPTPWADVTIETLSLEEKIAQCFMPLIPVDLTEEQIQNVEEFIRRYKIGGIFVGGPGTIEQQVSLLSRLQAVSKIPLLVGEDLEYGPAMRLSDGMHWPFAMTLGAVTDDTLVYQQAFALAQQARALGVHVTASPVADVNSNPKNPIINIRSFGATPQIVIPKVLASVKGLEDGGVLACIKHFPGHGDTHLDSHKALPVISYDMQRLNQIELAPFQAAIDEGAAMIMTGHLSVPALDSTGTPATMSKLIITDFLRKTLHFQGLVMTDALTMKALPDKTHIETNIDAINAGNDLLIYASAIPETIHGIIEFLNSPDVSKSQRAKIEAVFTERAHKILKAKEWLGAISTEAVQLDPRVAAGTPEFNDLKLRMYQQAMTVVRDEKKIIPLTNVSEKSVVLITRGQADPFVQQFSLYKHSDRIAVESQKSALDLSNYSVVIYVYVPPIVMVNGIQARMMNDELEPEVLHDLELLHKSQKNVVFVLCTSPFILFKLPKDLSVLVAYEPDALAQKAAADALCGVRPIVGRLPIILSDEGAA